MPDSRLMLCDAIEAPDRVGQHRFDFIYCDPPFLTGRRRTGRTKGKSRAATFEDRWPSMEAYIAWLEPRVGGMRKLLKLTGSFALHLDWHAVHYAKVMCDRLFGQEHFVNEIIWAFRTGGAGKRTLARKHDTILVYGKTGRYAFYPQYEKSYLSHKYGFSNITLESDDKGIYRNALMRDVWDIPALRGNQPESTGYPTQKPLQLLERLLACFTKPGDLVGDFFCGSGTTGAAALAGNRRFIGGDSSAAALKVAAVRVQC